MTLIRQMCLCAMLSALVVVMKEVLSFLPNVELVTFLFIMYALYLPRTWALLSCIIFCFVQTVLYGVGTWTVGYFIVWPLLIMLTIGVRSVLKTEQRCALFSGVFGLAFGFLFSIPYFIISYKMGWLFFMKGLPFDAIHGVSNYLIMLVLFAPITRVFQHLEKNGQIKRA